MNTLSVEIVLRLFNAQNAILATSYFQGDILFQKETIFMKIVSSAWVALESLISMIGE